MNSASSKRGGALISSASIADQYEKAIVALLRKMTEETVSELRAMFDDPGYAMDAIDGNPASRARIIINYLKRKYGKYFNKLAQTATERMIRQTIKHSTVTLNISLKEIAKEIELDPAFLNTGRFKEIVTASTQEAAQLIKTLPEQYLSQVQGQVMRSITTGTGLQTLVPFLREKYGQNVRKARSVAHDQTRKAYSNISNARMMAAGVEEFEWVHSRGGKVPRPQHVAWGGKIFRFDKPPVDDTFGPVLPGIAINCRCFARPILNFGYKDAS
ncbi:phage head morphogenesis protein [Paraburkholderia panacisoli]|uniref:Phage head morphogenesis protein n=1 Tax=Paraburkholderia panacisoli TaxID=2603818 RepID=A0A5B0HCJ6_9BURK|nr:minor capsid protein [Paraburkholderia panacisoli]KAA1013019.1 phage head morphogenesis protein [Paraburkholderia panacisoli]